MAWHVALPCPRLWKQKQDDLMQTSFKLVTQPVTQPFLRGYSVLLHWIATGALLKQVKQPGVQLFFGWDASLSQRLPPPPPGILAGYPNITPLSIFTPGWRQAPNLLSQ